MGKRRVPKHLRESLSLARAEKKRRISNSGDDKENVSRGYAKRLYRMYPPSVGKNVDAELEENVISALDSVPLETMRKYVYFL